MNTGSVNTVLAKNAYIQGKDIFFIFLTELYKHTLLIALSCYPVLRGMPLKFLPELIGQIILHVDDSDTIFSLSHTAPFVRDALLTEDIWEQAVYDILPEHYLALHKFKPMLSFTYHDYFLIIKTTLCHFCNRRNTIPYLNFQKRICTQCFKKHTMRDIILDGSAFDRTVFEREFQIQNGYLPPFDLGALSDIHNNTPRVSILIKDYLNCIEIYKLTRGRFKLKDINLDHSKLRKSILAPYEQAAVTALDKVQIRMKKASVQEDKKRAISDAKKALMDAKALKKSESIMDKEAENQSIIDIQEDGGKDSAIVGGSIRNAKRKAGVVEVDTDRTKRVKRVYSKSNHKNSRVYEQVTYTRGSHSKIDHNSRFNSACKPLLKERYRRIINARRSQLRQSIKGICRIRTD